jgi:hypothetical protein
MQAVWPGVHRLDRQKLLLSELDAGRGRANLRIGAIARRIERDDRVVAVVAAEHEYTDERFVGRGVIRLRLR